VQAQGGIPAPPPAHHLPEFQTVLQPFTGRSFATGIGQSEAGIGPVALVAFPDHTLLASGGPARNQLLQLSPEGGRASTPLVPLPFPIYHLALDAAGNLWATTGGGPLLQLDPATGAILHQYGDGITQALAINPKSGLVYVSSGNGIEVFDPTL